MSLSINPLAKLIGQASSAIAQATNQANASLPSDTSILSKAQLDSVTDRLGGGLTSGLNGLANGARQAATALGQVAGSVSNVTADIAGGLNKLAGGNLAGGLLTASAGISGAAGAINNVLSLFRGANIPKGAELFVKEAPAISLLPSSKDDWRVRINANWNLFPGNPLFEKLKETGGVVWPYLPNITVSTKANYSQIDAIHSNYPFYAYKNSQVDEIQISGDFSAETEFDAAYWIAATTFFKTATKMFFGSSDFSGNPPMICHLYGYGSSIFDKVPVIIKSFSVDLKDDTNYVKCGAYGEINWVPIISTISVTVTPIYNRANLRKFNLQSYASGKMTESSPNGIGYL
jgi:hypothetical protein